MEPFHCLFVLKLDLILKVDDGQFTQIARPLNPCALS